MTIASILRDMAGVWEGTYTVVGADGSLIERFASRQEGRMSGEHWMERVLYLRDGTEPVTQFFHAIVHDDDVQFQNADMWGSTKRAGADTIMFSFGWKARPAEKIVEVSTPTADYRTRLWQHIVDGTLARVTIIEERRNHRLVPVEWWPEGVTPPAAT